MDNKSTITKDINNSIFFLNAAMKGDRKALTIFNLITKINQVEFDLFMNRLNYGSEEKAKMNKLLFSLKARKDSLIIRYDLKCKKEVNGEINIY